MKKLALLLVISFLTQTANAKQISVTLDSSETLIRDHSVSLAIYVKYADGHEHSTELFSAKELKAGIKTKPYFIAQNAPVTVCRYTWTIMKSPPGPSKTGLELLLPEGLDQSLTNDCNVVPGADELKLTFGSYRLKTLRVRVAAGAFEAHAAKALIYRIQPKGADPYKSFQKVVTPASAPHEMVKNILYRGAIEFSVGTQWVMKSGGSSKGTAVTTKDFEIEIK